MHVRVLGAAAGGGSPQGNCGCPTCEAIRDSSCFGRPRTQCSIAVSAGGSSWFLVNASPDICSQVEAFSQWRQKWHRGAWLSYVQRALRFAR